MSLQYMSFWEVQVIAAASIQNLLSHLLARSARIEAKRGKQMWSVWTTGFSGCLELDYSTHYKKAGLFAHCKWNAFVLWQPWPWGFAELSEYKKIKVIKRCHKKNITMSRLREKRMSYILYCFLLLFLEKCNGTSHLIRYMPHLLFRQVKSSVFQKLSSFEW